MALSSEVRSVRKFTCAPLYPESNQRTAHQRGESGLLHLCDPQGVLASSWAVWRRRVRHGKPPRAGSFKYAGNNRFSSFCMARKCQSSALCST